jgi:hypothetical protein
MPWKNFERLAGSIDAPSQRHRRRSSIFRFSGQPQSQLGN